MLLNVNAILHRYGMQMHIAFASALWYVVDTKGHTALSPY
jgi:hypothetical protein